MAHTPNQIKDAVEEHGRYVRFLNACNQSKARGIDIRVAAKLNSKEFPLHLPADAFASTITEATRRMRAIETEYDFEPAAIEEAKKPAPKIEPAKVEAKK